MLCQGQGYWESKLPQIHKHKDVRVMNKRSGGTTYGSYWLTFIYRKEIVIDIVTLKPKMGRVIGSFRDTWVGGKKYHTTKGSGVTAHEIVDWQGNLCVTHR